MLEGFECIKDFTDGEHFYMITGEEKMNKKLRIVTKLDGVLDEACEFILNEANTKFYFDKTMNMVDDVTEQTRFALLDTGLLKGDLPVFMIMNHFGGIFFGCALCVGASLPPAEVLRTGLPFEVAERRMEIFRGKYEEAIKERSKMHLDMDELRPKYGK